MRINRKGITRIVIVFKTFVVKIPNFTCQWNHFLKGIIANINENQTWKYADDKQQKLLCPVRFCSWGGWILVMKRAEPFSWDDVIDYGIWEKAGYGGDDKPFNYGLFDNRAVKLDYGQ